MGLNVIVNVYQKRLR